MTDARDDATRETDRTIWAEVMESTTPNDAMGTSAFMGASEIATMIVIMMMHDSSPHRIFREMGAIELRESLERTLRYEATRRGGDGSVLRN